MSTATEDSTDQAPESESVDRADLIPTLRHQIDALDEAIAQLVLERTRLSQRIQNARVNSGGTRIELGRERVVIDHYRNTLGADGATLGEAVLRVGRGKR
jgi:chorismate mutase